MQFKTCEPIFTEISLEIATATGHATAAAVAHLSLSFSLSLFLDYDILTNELSGELAACQTSFGVG